VTGRAAPATVKRGDIVLAAIQGDYGKLRPFLIVQADAITAHGFGSVVVVCPLTTILSGQTLCRVTVEPTPETGLRERSEIMVEKLRSPATDRLRDVIGHLDAATMRAVDRALLLVLGFS
jgi:mRNA interferase MazF